MWNRKRPIRCAEELHTEVVRDVDAARGALICVACGNVRTQAPSIMDSMFGPYAATAAMRNLIAGTIFYDSTAPT